mgnify:CR=1 FL=1
MSEAAAREVLSSWPGLADAPLRRVTAGLINLTFRVEGPRGAYSLQRLNPIFGREVHQDIDRVTAHLAAAGLVTPRLVPTAEGALDLAHPGPVEQGGGVWRLMTWVEGECCDRVDGPGRARQAGRLLGRFHAALADFTAPFAHRRLGVHDTPAHLAGLERALEEHRAHPDHDRIRPLGEAILQAAEKLPPLPRDPERVVHGDPKISNLIFDPSGEALALVDLDTVARMPLALELGDAFRSWCNPAGEDAAAARFDLALFEAAVTGYAETAGSTLTEAEKEAFVAGARTVMVELAARFCRDALEERYFGWDPGRFPSRSAHNRIRAEGQLTLAQNLFERAREAEARVEAAFTRRRPG